jgi:transposase InsO family protein
LDRSSAPVRQPTAIHGDVITLIERLRREHKWSAARIAFELQQADIEVSRRTVSRTLQRLQLNRREFIDPNGDTNREPQRIVALRPGHMAHIDVKKVGKIPDGGGWRAHGRGSPRPELQLARRLEEPGPATSTFTRQSTGTRASPTPTAVAFLDRARDWFAAHGITYIERIVTDNGACYRAEAFAAALNGSRHQRITPSSCGLQGLDRDAGGLRTKPSPRRRFGFCSSVSSS